MSRALISDWGTHLTTNYGGFAKNVPCNPQGINCL
jgi:hypothetical protein